MHGSRHGPAAIMRLLLQRLHFQCPPGQPSVRLGLLSSAEYRYPFIMGRAVRVSSIISGSAFLQAV